MNYTIKRVYFPEGAEVDIPFAMPVPGTIERAAIEVATGRAAIWYTHCERDEGGADRTFVVVRDGGVVEADGIRHCGMWWEAGVTLHLYEMFDDAKWYEDHQKRVEAAREVSKK